MPDDTTTRELNRLYWESDASISEITDRLDISKRALYDGIEPRPSGAACPECGEPLVYRNRTAAETGEAECEACGRTVELEEPEEIDPVAEQQRSAAPLAPLRRSPPPGSGPALALALLIGMAVGAAAGWLLRRE